MISYVLHTVAPDRLAIAEEEFAANLSKGSTDKLFAVECVVSTLLGHLPKTVCCKPDSVHRHVVGTLTNAHSVSHAKSLVELASRFGIDAEGTCCAGGVFGNQVWSAAPNDRDCSRGWKRKVNRRCNCFGQGFKIVLARLGMVLVMVRTMPGGGLSNSRRSKSVAQI